MADLASMLIGGAQQSEQNAGAGLSQGVQQGVQNYQGIAQLALHKQQLDMQQQQMQMQMQQLQNTKMEKFYDFLGQAKNVQNASDRNNYLKTAVGYANAMGLPQEAVPREEIMNLKTDESQQRMATLETYVKSNQMTPADAIELATNPLKRDKFMQVPMTPLGFMNKSPDLNQAQEFVINKETEKQKAALQVEAETRRQNVQLSHMDEMQAMKELGDFGKQALNPSTRSVFGQTKAMIDAADSVKQLTDANLPANANKEQRIEAYNKLTSQQQAEVVVGMDRLLSRGNPSVHGNEALTPPTTPQELMAKWGQQLGNVPVGADKGAFIENMMQTINRERNMNNEKYQAQAKALKDAYPLAAKVYGDRMDRAMEAASRTPNITQGMAQPGQSSNPFANADAATIRAYIQAHPSNADVPQAKAALEAMGG